MSYNKKTWAPKDKITSAALNNIETGVEGATPVYVPFTLTESEGTITVTTTATFATVKTAVEEQKNVIAAVDIGSGTGEIYLPLKAKSPKSDPTTLVFAGAVELSTEGSPEPEILKIVFTADGATGDGIPLTVAT